MRRDRPTRPARPLAPAFTLVELLVVIAVIAIVIAIVGPAIGRIIESNRYASAVNTVTGTLGNARALAMRTGRATAVLFLYDSEAEQVVVRIVQEAPSGSSGSLTDRSGGTVGRTQAAAFTPALGVPAVALPAGVGVFGLRPQGYPQSDDFRGGEGLVDRRTSVWYFGESDFTSPGDERRVVPWIFPRNDARVFLDPDADPDLDPWRDDEGDIEISEDLVRTAQSFGVLFAEQGSIGSWFEIGAGEQIEPAYLEFSGQPRLLREDRDDPLPYDNPTLFDPEAEPSDPEFGEPNPEVRFRTVSQLAVVNLRTLNETLGTSTPLIARLRPSSSKIAPDGATDVLEQIEDDDGFELSGADRDRLVISVSEWIDANAEILDFNRYSGAVIRREVQ